MNDRKGLLLCSAAALLALAAPVHAAAPPAAGPAAAQSYADLLAPIPNAATLLQADNAQHEAQPAPLQLAQLHHHHHHHHSRFRFYGGRPYYYGPAYYYGPHCWWTWGRPVWNGWRWVRRRIRVCN